jgi:hypothetical protein
LGARLLGLVLAGLFLVVFVPLLILYGLHAIWTLLLPVNIVRSAIETRRERESQRQLARSMAGSPPTAVMAPNAKRSVAWGIAGLIFPAVGPVALWYGWDALRFVRLSGGGMAGECQARAGIVLGVVGTVELVLLFVVVAMVPTK